MSEQTPDTNSGVSETQEPSMEDILASIRKIIADDDIQEQSETMEATPDVSAPVNQEGDVSQMVHMEDTLDLDVIAEPVTPEPSADIDELLGNMDVTGTDALDIASEANDDVAPNDLEDILDLEIPMEDDITASPEDTLESVLESAPEAVDVSIDSDASDSELALDDDVLELAIDTDLVLSDDIVTEAEEVVAETSASNGLAGSALAALGLGSAAVAATSLEEISNEEELSNDEVLEDDLSLMLDNMLEETEALEDTDIAIESVLETELDPAEDLLNELELSEDLTEDITVSDQPSEQTDPDMELVKSLMADLTEEPLHDEPEADIEVPDDITLIADIDDDGDASSDDVMDEILSMTLNDEAKLSEELAIPEIEAPEVETTPVEPEVSEDVSVSDSLSLKEIAAAAEADAKASEDGLSGALLAGLGAAAIGGGVAVASNEQDDTDEQQSDDVDKALSQLDDLLEVEADTSEGMPTADTLMPEEPVHIIPENLIEETPDMARAKKTDAIIDDVTETATAGAFASLNQVVEEKATVAERGDRIGDLVQEALRPMLKDWLDANLKGIVERAVTKEVKRISSGK